MTLNHKEKGEIRMMGLEYYLGQELKRGGWKGASL